MIFYLLSLMIVKVNVIVTGPPRSGKSTVIKKVIDELRKSGLKVGGIMTPQILIRGRRYGFKIVDIYTGGEKILASIDIKSRTKVSKYGVDLGVLESFGVEAIRRAIDSCDIIIIDEIGKMECLSKSFRNIVEMALNSDKAVLATIPMKTRDPFILSVKKRRDVIVFNVLEENKDKLAIKILRLVGGYDYSGSR
ncbi:MAG: hypothetical protein DRN81_01715 [Thermoproteota archaeon]|nr:MAG: hypothetical protein DRN81_01715 [Candidatus Korarchaeota archaeon]